RGGTVGRPARGRAAAARLRGAGPGIPPLLSRPGAARRAVSDRADQRRPAPRRRQPEGIHAHPHHGAAVAAPGGALRGPSIAAPAAPNQGFRRTARADRPALSRTVRRIAAGSVGALAVRTIAPTDPAAIRRTV